MQTQTMKESKQEWLVFREFPGTAHLILTDENLDQATKCGREVVIGSLGVNRFAEKCKKCVALSTE